MFKENYFTENLVAGQNEKPNHKEQQAIVSITKLLEQFDFNDYQFSTHEPERLLKLLASFKGDRLNSYEIDLVYEIVKKQEKLSEKLCEFESTNLAQNSTNFKLLEKFD